MWVDEALSIQNGTGAVRGAGSLKALKFGFIYLRK
jgi:hypothetical protein